MRHTSAPPMLTLEVSVTESRPFLSNRRTYHLHSFAALDDSQQQSLKEDLETFGVGTDMRYEDLKALATAFSKCFTGGLSPKGGSKLIALTSEEELYNRFSELKNYLRGV